IGLCNGGGGLCRSTFSVVVSGSAAAFGNRPTEARRPATALVIFRCGEVGQEDDDDDDDVIVWYWSLFLSRRFCRCFLLRMWQLPSLHLVARLVENSCEHRLDCVILRN
uniref:Uncharacterized protein n=1 Tax=Physcomitrium patens TaxID=3218 RepID=A0A7I3Z477_PHYPA